MKPTFAKLLRRLALSLPFVVLSSCGDPFASTVETAVAHELKDPESAQFRDVDYYPDAKLACGDVNAKNSYGAKAGYSGFIYDSGIVEFEGGHGYLTGLEKCTEQIRKHTAEIMKSLPKESRVKLEQEFERDGLNQSETK